MPEQSMTTLRRYRVGLSLSGHFQDYWPDSLLFRCVYRFCILSFLTAMAKAPLLPTSITSFFPRVIAVYNRFLCRRM